MMSDETNETIGRQLARLASRVAEIEGGVEQMKRDASQVRRDIALMLGGRALVSREMSQLRAVLDRHDRMIGTTGREPGMAPHTVSPVALFIAGALLFVPGLCAVLFSSEAFNTQDPVSLLVVWAVVIISGAVGVVLITAANLRRRPNPRPIAARATHVRQALAAPRRY